MFKRWFKKEFGTFGLACKDLPFKCPKGVKKWKIKFRCEDYPIAVLWYANGNLVKVYPHVERGLFGKYLTVGKGCISMNRWK